MSGRNNHKSKFRKRRLNYTYKRQENNKPIFKLYYEFKTLDGETYTVMARTHLTSVLLGEDSEPLVYNPEEAIFIDLLPIKVRKYLNKYIEEYKQQNSAIFEKSTF